MREQEDAPVDVRADVKRCPVHDVATPRKIAQLEVELGINPEAVNELMATNNLIAMFSDPDLTDCGRQWCRERRGRA